MFPDWFVDHMVRDELAFAELRRLRRESLLTRIALGMWPRDLRLMTTSESSLRQFEGLDFATIARRLHMLAADAEAYVARRSSGAATVLLENVMGDAEHESLLDAVISHPGCAISTGAILVGPAHTSWNPLRRVLFPVFWATSRVTAVCSLSKRLYAG